MRKKTKVTIALFVLPLLVLGSGGELLSRPGQVASKASPSGTVRELRVLILSTMLAEAGIGEWGFAALLEADGHRILFDTGARPGTVLSNARELGVDLSTVKHVVLSHYHGDHTGGLVPLRRELRKQNEDAISETHVGRGIFWSRPGPSGKERNSMTVAKTSYEELGGDFVEHSEPAEIFPGVWLTGSVPRVHPERNWSGTGKVQTPDGLREDTIPESQSLVVDTDKGLVVVSGCGHAGIINTLEYARKKIHQAPIHAAVGGFHLFRSSDESLQWTGKKLRDFKLGHFVGAHCTGIEAVFQIREHASLGRDRSVVGAVGASFSLDAGIDPLSLAR
jgi:7,8-dihydropterin-6-yl-methyl-4-(beta-D-ribofuranosyl)aminobenzene 5'-phosphate synthase